MRDIKQEVDETRNYVRGYGYRPVTKADVVPGREVLMVSVELFFDTSRKAGWAPHIFASATQIRIDDEPTKVAGHRPNDEQIVYYHCTSPVSDMNCFVGLTDFTRDAYVNGDPYANDYRYFVKD